MGLRPQTERTLGGAAAAGVHGQIRVQQERHVVAAEIEIAFVGLGDPGQRVEIFDYRRVGVVLKTAVLSEDNAGDFVQRFALGEVAYLVVEFTLHDKIDGGRGTQGGFGLDSSRRPDERNFHLGIQVAHHLGDLHVNVKTRGGRKQD